MGLLARSVTLLFKVSLLVIDVGGDDAIDCALIVVLSSILPLFLLTSSLIPSPIVDEWSIEIRWVAPPFEALLVFAALFPTLLSTALLSVVGVRDEDARRRVSTFIGRPISARK